MNKNEKEQKNEKNKKTNEKTLQKDRAEKNGF